MHFILCEVLHLKKGILLHTFTLHQIDSRIDKLIFTYLATLGYKGKNSIVLEISLMRSMSKLEDRKFTTKISSSKYSSCIAIVILCAFISIDETEKRLYVMQIDSNSDARNCKK